MLWDKSKSEIVFSKFGCLIFDDTVLDKNRSIEIEAVRKQWSGNQHRVIRGIGVVGCVYYNPELKQTYLIDYRIFDPDTDGLKKTEHAMEMFTNIIHNKQHTSPDFKFQYVLFDAAYANKKFLALIANSNHLYLCNMKNNRTCWEIGISYTNSDKELHNKPVQFKDLDWTTKALTIGKVVRLKDFPITKQVKLFKITVSTDRTDYIVTNDMTINDPKVIKSVNGLRWNIESFHREIKQTTGIEACECRKNRSQRNHINLALRAWMLLKKEARKVNTTIYQLKQNQLDNYYIQTMKTPMLKFEW
jgi:SRSO17 transposase